MRRELERALELGKNVVPVLLEGGRIIDVSPDFPRRDQLLAINAFPLPFELFAEAISTLYERFLSNPTLQELEIKTAEEHFKAGEQATELEDWAGAESEYEKAMARRRRPEYLLGLGVAKHKQGRHFEALNDLDAAISADPFAFDLMNAKFNLLQDLDRMREALDFTNQWKRQAEQRANRFAERILEHIAEGYDLPKSLRSIPELTFLYGHMPPLGEVGTSVGCLLEHISGDLKHRLLEVWESWRKENKDKLRTDWESWDGSI